MHQSSGLSWFLWKSMQLLWYIELFTYIYLWLFTSLPKLVYADCIYLFSFNFPGFCQGPYHKKKSETIVSKSIERWLTMSFLFFMFFLSLSVCCWSLACKQTNCELSRIKISRKLIWLITTTCGLHLVYCMSSAVYVVWSLFCFFIHDRNFDSIFEKNYDLDFIVDFSWLTFINFLSLHSTIIQEALSLFVNKNCGCDDAANNNDL